MQQPEHKNLFPDREVTLPRPDGQDETVTVEAIRFGSYFKAEPLARPILADLANIDDESKSAPDAGSMLDRAYDAFHRHQDNTFALLALSTGKPVEWLEALPFEDGRLLLFEFIDANHPFFLSLLGDRGKVLKAAAQVILALQKSSPNLSAPASAAVQPR